MSTDDDLRSWVSEELEWDPKVHADAIAVSADGGEVTLRGTVGSVRERLEAQKAAARVAGVRAVENHLTVKLLNEHGRENAELRGDVLRALTLDSIVPTSIDARVDDGWVTLTGSADWQFEREEAELVAGSVFGVLGVVDEVMLNHKPAEAGDIQLAIKNAFERHAKLDAKKLDVDANNGTVTVTGTVASQAEHDSAIDAAWAAPGVTRVEDRVLVAR